MNIFLDTKKNETKNKIKWANSWGPDKKNAKDAEKMQKSALDVGIDEFFKRNSQIVFQNGNDFRKYSYFCGILRDLFIEILQLSLN